MKHQWSIIFVSVLILGLIGSTYAQDYTTSDSGIEEITTLRGHSDSVHSVTFSPDGRLLASGSADRTIKIWNVSKREEIATLEGHSDSVYSVTFSPDGRLLASGSWDNTIKLWNVSKRKEIATLKGHSDSVYSVAFSPDGNLLASGSADRTIKIWNVSKREEIATLEGHSDFVHSVTFSPDGKLLASGSADRTIKIWNVSKREEIALLNEHSSNVWSVTFSPYGNLLASGSTDRTIKIWNVVTESEVSTLRHSRNIRSVTFSPDGKLLASGSTDRTIKIWDISTESEITTLRGHSDFVHSVKFSPVGNLLASGSWDRKIKLWHLPPVLNISLDFTEPSGNKELDGYETGTLIVEIDNRGIGAARQVEIQLSAQPQLEALLLPEPRPIAQIEPQSTETIDFPLSCSEPIESTEVELFVEVLENGMGMEAEPVSTTITIRGLRPPPELKLTWDFDHDAPGNSINRETIKITIENIGEGDAEEVSVTPEISVDNVLDMSDNAVFELGEILAGGKKGFTFTFDVSPLFSRYEIPINLSIEERRPEFNRTDKIIIPNIPQTQMSNPDAIGVVIGNKEYEHFNNVKFAAKDARIMREYLIKTLGYRKDNIIYVENATKAKFEEIFGTAEKYRGRLYNWIRENESDVFIYYSGHGMPSSESERGYLVPVNCVSLSGYPMSTFYANLNKIKARSYIVVIDTCFSGRTPTGNLLDEISGTPPPKYLWPSSTSTEYPLGENGTVFASAEGDQVSNWYPEKKHSMFTYFFLKGLSGDADKDRNGDITVSELNQFINDPNSGVPYYSRRFGKVEQTPVTMGEKNRVIVRLK